MAQPDQKLRPQDQDSVPGTPGPSGSEIAIVGMACRFPGASTIEAFWQNLRGGVESLRELTDAELLAAGVPPAVMADPRYVRRASVIEGIEDFDAGFFGYTPQEATIMDPQHRLFLECAWEVFEQAGYDPERYPRPVGVFTGAKTNTYLFAVVAERARFPGLENFQIALGNDLAAMATRVSYKLDLRGPSYALHTACSTSLVAVHLACQSLLLDECAMAVAGGAAINVPQKRGYLYTKGGILSPDGSCRTFDHRSAGSNFGNGVGAVLLKRLDDALADGDTIYAVLRGSATNNDGAAKASFASPGVEGQTAVLLEAMAVAGVEAEDLSYLEAHGTATELGDSIEILALGKAFRASSARRGFCALGSAKTNLGHLETVAGVAGLIKTALALHHRELPPSLHFERANPNLGLEASPFVVQTELTPWARPAPGKKRIAGVSSFGIGSTNAHVIVEEAPAPAATSPDRPWQLLRLSAKTATALATQSAELGRHLEAHPELALADVAFTLAAGRKSFEHRRTVVARDTADAARALAKPGPGAAVGTTGRRVVFLFPGLGEHFVDMGLGLYQREPAYRAVVDACAEHLEPWLGLDLRTVLYPRGTDAAERAGGLDLKAMLGRGGARTAEEARLDRTALAQPALFVTEVALARLLQSHGVEPKAMIGYSLGEYVCAHLAGVLSLEDSLALVAERARAIDRLPAGAMLAVPLDEAEVAERLAAQGLSLAAANGASGVVAAGAPEAVAELEAELRAEGIACRRLETTHAFHAAGMAAIADEVLAFARKLTFRAPQLPYVSNVTGTWVTDAEATDPSYWVRHLTQTVRFGAGVGELLALEHEPALLEVGPGQSLTSLARLHPRWQRGRAVLPTMRAHYGGGADAAAYLGALGELWLAGVDVPGETMFAGERRRRVPLPTYPFERRRYWIDADESSFTRAQGGERAAAPAGMAAGAASLTRVEDLGSWLYQPVWRPAEATAVAPPAAGQRWLLVTSSPAGPLAEVLAERLRVGGAERVVLCAAEDETCLAELLTELGPARVVHLASLAEGLPVDSAAGFEAAQGEGLWSLVALARAGATRVDVVASGVEAVLPGEVPKPERAPLAAAAIVLPQELPQLRLRLLDVEPGAGPELLEPLLGWLAEDEAAPLAALRGGARWARLFERAALPPCESALRPAGGYLLLGGLGGLGLELAGHLFRHHGARLTLTRRTPLPPREHWRTLLGTEGELDTRTRRALVAVLELEEAGAEVHCLALDLGDAAAVAAAVTDARARFGALHGVFQLTGVLTADVFEPLVRLGRASWERQLAPKVHGLYALERALEAVPELELCVLFSSISAYLGGGLGSLAYAAANAAVEAFAARHNQRSGALPWRAIAWDSWRERDEVPTAGFGATLAQLAMAPEEGLEVLERLLALPTPVARPIVSTGDLGARWEQWVARPRRRAPAPAVPPSALPAGALEGRVAALWERVLGRTGIGHEENFFDLGGNSLLGLQLIADLNRELGPELGRELVPTDLFEAPTIAGLALLATPAPAVAAPVAAPRALPSADERAIAIVGMSGRFPGAPDLATYWQNLAAGVESVSFFDPEQLAASGVDPEVAADPRYVPARPVMAGAELFDAGLFGYSPREAELMDPQHRVFLECAWSALEDAGYDPQRFAGPIGTFGGSALNTYLLHHVLPNAEELAGADPLAMIIGSDKDSLTTNVSYRLDLKGPSLAVQTYCSTALVAVHLAVQALRAGDCDLALAGGVSLVMPQETGHTWLPDSILTPDGHCRPFDAAAAGTLFGNGVGIVVLKRLADALADGDTIRAVVRGSAINNDGALKVGYTAPSVVGQAQVVAAALADAAVEPATIAYVEAHGTGTALGDPIEVAALSKAFREQTGGAGLPPASCALSSVKGNLGHLDRAAGVASLIKAVLALEHGQVPPTLHFERPNPKIDFGAGPFFVATTLTPIPERAPGTPRRAGVSALGFGGTNVHVVLEEAPPAAPGKVPGALQGPSDQVPGALPAELLVLSARTAGALERGAEQLAAHLETSSEPALADVAFTLQVGRRQLAERRFLVVGERAEGVRALRGGQGGRATVPTGAARRLAFVFPGQGSQHAGMARELYEREPVFRRELDRVAELAAPGLGLDLRTLLFPAAEDFAAADLRLAETHLTQPALFAVEHALAEMWRAWGLVPTALAGHSVGELVAASQAGVFALADAVALVVERGRLIGELPGGAMLSVALPEAELVPRLERLGLSLAAVNAHDRLVASGSVEAIAALADELGAAGVEHRRLRTSHAFHSGLVEPAAAAFAAAVARVPRQAPSLPFVSCLTGSWITPEAAVDPDYWGRQLRGAVRFAAVLETLAAEPGRVLLEVGPGESSTRLARRQLGTDSRVPAVASLPPAGTGGSAAVAALEALGRLWAVGVGGIDWSAVHGGAPRRRVPLPTYSFDHQRYCLDPNPPSAGARAAARPEEWLWQPSWRRQGGAGAVPAVGLATPGTAWLWFGSSLGFGTSRAGRDGLALPLAEHLGRLGRRLVRVLPGSRFGAAESDAWSVRPGSRTDLAALLDVLGASPEAVLFEEGWGGAGPEVGAEVAQALAEVGVETAFWWLTAGAHAVLGVEPGGAGPLLARCAELERTLPRLACRHLDLEPGLASPAETAAQIVTEVLARPARLSTAWRGTSRFVPSLEPLPSRGTAARGMAPTAAWPARAVLATGGLEPQGGGALLALALAARERREELAIGLLEAEPLPEVTASEPQAAELEAALAAEIARTELPAAGMPSPPTVAAQTLPAGFEAASDALVAAYALDLLTARGGVVAARPFTRVELMASLGVVPPYERFVDFLLAALVADGWLEPMEAGWSLRAAELPDPRALEATLAERYGELLPGLECLAHCAAHAAEVLAGRLDPRAVLAPEGNARLLAGLLEVQARYSWAPSLRRAMAATLAEAAAARRAQSRPLRVLEIGAGEGALTWELLEALQALVPSEELPTRLAYVATDVEKPFVEGLRRVARQRGLEGVLQAERLDATQGPTTQGFEPHSFDAVVVQDTLHLLPALGGALEALREVLVPGGLLLALEPGRDQRWVTMVWGLTPDWWRFEDTPLRPTSPVLAPERWAALLADQGFEPAPLLPLDEKADHVLVAARGPRQLRTPAFVERVGRELEAERARGAARLARHAALEAAGARLAVRVADPASPAAVTAGVAALESELGPLDGAVHAAGGCFELAALEAALGERALGLAWLVAPLTESAVEAAAEALDLAWAERAARRGAPWQSLGWGLASVAPALAARALGELLARGNDERRVLLARRPPLAAEGLWSTLPPKRAEAQRPTRCGETALEETPERPWSELERELARIWGEVLGVPRLQLGDSFFELGGDSLIATQLQTRLRDRLGVEVAIGRLFEDPTLEGQARAVAELAAGRERERQERLLGLLAGMTEEEAERALAELGDASVELGSTSR